MLATLDRVLSWFRRQSRLTQEYVAPPTPEHPMVLYELLDQHDDDLDDAKVRVAKLREQYEDLKQRGILS